MVCLPVSAENIGRHSLTFKPSPTGLPNNVGSCPGASGAQFRGVAIHEAPQKLQLIHSIIVSISSEISSVASLILSSAHINQAALSVLSIESSLSGIPSLSVSI